MSRDVENWAFRRLLVGMLLGAAMVENGWATSSSSGTGVWPTCPRVPERAEYRAAGHCCVLLFTATLFTVARRSKQSKCPSVEDPTNSM